MAYCHCKGQKSLSIVVFLLSFFLSFLRGLFSACTYFHIPLQNVFSLQSFSDIAVICWPDTSPRHTRKCIGSKKDDECVDLNSASAKPCPSFVNAFSPKALDISATFFCKRGRNIGILQFPPPPNPTRRKTFYNGDIYLTSRSINLCGVARDSPGRNVKSNRSVPRPRADPR